MSSHVKATTEFTSAVALQKALESMYGVGKVKVAQNVFEPSLALRNYYGSPISGLKVSFCVPREVSHNHADLGFAYQASGTFSLEMDHMDHVDKKELKLQYEVAAMEINFATSFPGVTLVQQRQANGDLILVAEGFE